MDQNSVKLHDDSYSPNVWDSASFLRYLDIGPLDKVVQYDSLIIPLKDRQYIKKNPIINSPKSLYIKMNPYLPWSRHLARQISLCSLRPTDSTIVMHVVHLSLTCLIYYHKTIQISTHELPLSKSLGYSIQHKLGTNLEDYRLNKEYLELYQEMIKASQKSLEKLQDSDEDREKDVGRVKMDVRKRGAAPIDRRSIHRRRSAIGHRRARSQAVRREKLNSQSLRSHQQHIRQSGRLYFDTD